MKVVLVQQNYKVGDVAGNVAKMKQAVVDAADKYGAEWAVFGKDAVTGSPLFGLADTAAFRRLTSEAKVELETFARAKGMRLVLSDNECE